MKAMFVLMLAAAVLGRVQQPTCAEGGVCTDAELLAMSKEELVARVQRLSGNAVLPRAVGDTAANEAWPPVWPMPQEYTNGTTRLVVNGAEFLYNAPAVSDMSAVVKRYIPLIFPRASEAPEGTAMTEIVITVDALATEVQLGMDESYTLVIPDDGSAATLTAKTLIGAYRGLETFSQLVMFDYSAKQYYIPGAPWKITDYPRFAHREVLLDSSRHFLPVPTLKNIITALSYLKINTIHWHIVDSQSFPMPLPSYMHFSEKGAYTPAERYTVEELEDLVAYARQHGMRIMPELDVPGHAASWCAGDPKMCPSTTCLEPLNVMNEYTFTTLDGMIGEMTKIFPDTMIHLGGDEVNTDCWSNTPEIQAWMTEQGMTANDAYKYFVNRVHEIAHNHNRTVVGWEEIYKNFGTDLHPDTIVHQWLRDSVIAADAIAKGYRVLFSTNNYWYLDYLGTSWTTMYTAEPCTGVTDEQCATYMLGGGGEMWGETVDTSDIQATIFPRVAAIAERLWSPRSVNDANAAAARYANIRCLLNKRGVGAAPSQNANARTAPSGPGSCLQ